jgi:hypothetical protein
MEKLHLGIKSSKDLVSTKIERYEWVKHCTRIYINGFGVLFLLIGFYTEMKKNNK